MFSTDWRAEVERFVARYFAAFSAADADAVWEMQTDELKRAVDRTVIGIALRANQRLASDAIVSLRGLQLAELGPGLVEATGSLEWVKTTSGIVTHTEEVVWIIVLEDGDWKWAGADRAKGVLGVEHRPAACNQETERVTASGRLSASNDPVTETISGSARRFEAEALVKRMIAALSQRDASTIWEGLSGDGRVALDRELLAELMKTDMFTSGRHIALNKLELFELARDRIEARLSIEWLDPNSGLLSETTEEIWVLVQEDGQWKLWAGQEGWPNT